MNPRSLLSPLSSLYGLAARLDRLRKVRRARTFPIPVLSVGNIIAGGSGKTPVTIELVRKLSTEYDVIVLTRGYGRESSGQILWRAGEPIPPASQMGDEPHLIARSMKNGWIGVGADRSEALQRILAELPSSARPLAILDDGFQHHQLNRSLDIVIVDDRTASERRLLPAGYLREQHTALGRADILLVTSDAAESCARHYGRSDALICCVEYTPGIISHWRTGRRPAPERCSALLVTGIAAPERVLKSAKIAGIQVLDAMPFRDHHQYSERDVVRIMERYRHCGADVILTTEKDAVKLESFPELEESLHVLTLQVSFHTPDMLYAYIASHMKISGHAVDADRNG